MPGVKLDHTGAGSDPSALRLGGGRQIFGTHEVGRRLLLPCDLARGRVNGVSDFPVRRLSACSVVTSSQSCRNNSHHLTLR